MKKIILNLAMSLDGFIADQDGGYDWIHGHDTASSDEYTPADFALFLNNIDVVVMGRKSYDECGVGGFEDKTVYVATRNPLPNYDNVIFVQEDICAFIQTLKQQTDQSIYLFGGGILVDNFIKSDMIDEYVIGIVPIILGTGRPLFLENNPTIGLHLEEIKNYNGVVILRYTRPLQAKDSHD